MKIVSTICGPFDEARYKRVKKAYQAAVEAKQEVFKFDGGDLLTQFAKYLVEFLDGHFGGNNART